MNRRSADDQFEDLLSVNYRDMPQSDPRPNLDDLDRKILAYPEREDWPVTTEMVAKEIPSSWNTAQLHLYKLKSEGLVKGKGVGRQNQWMLSDRRKKIARV